MNSVIKKYVEEKKELEHLLYQDDFNFNSDIADTKKRIQDIDKIIDKYYSILAKQSSINNDNLTSEQISKLKDEIAVDKIGLPEDIINYFNLYAEVNSPTVRQVGSYDYYFDRRRELKDKVSKIYQNPPISLYGRSEVKVDSSIKRELDYIDDILATYDKLKDNISKIRRLQNRKDISDRDELIRLSNEIKNDKNKLPLKLLRELEDYFINDHIDRKVKIQTDEEKVAPVPLAVVDRPKKDIRREKVKIKTRKKGKFRIPKGLIIAGVSAMAIAVVMALEALSSSVSSAISANDISTLASTMIDNANLWHSVDTTYQEVLHNVNTEIASNISNLTGQTTAFDGASGIWHIGDVDLATFANNAQEIAKGAINKVASISASAVLLFAGGIPVLKKGIKLNNEQKKNEGIYTKKVNDILNYYKNYTTLDFVPLDYFHVKNLYNEIKNNKNISSYEKDEMLSKLDNLLHKSASAITFDFNGGGKVR